MTCFYFNNCKDRAVEASQNSCSRFSTMFFPRSPPAMNDTSQLGLRTSANSDSSGPSTLEIVIGILALVIALAAVAVAVVQVWQAKTARLQKPDPEPLEPIVLSRSPSAEHSFDRLLTIPRPQATSLRYEMFQDAISVTDIVLTTRSSPGADDVDAPAATAADLRT